MLNTPRPRRRQHFDEGDLEKGVIGLYGLLTTSTDIETSTSTSSLD
jgi:hypothetical protein